MSTIDLTPQVLDLVGWGGDTFPIEVRFPPGWVAGRVWSAQVRSAAVAGVVDAQFVVTLGATEDDPVVLMLTAEATRTLVEAAAAVRVQGQAPAARLRRGVRAAGDPVATYSGVWDCQVAPAGGGDPTTTVAKGSVKLTLDVTRLP